jgi:hypothetical protein
MHAHHRGELRANGGEPVDGGDDCYQVGGSDFTPISDLSVPMIHVAGATPVGG